MSSLVFSYKAPVFVNIEAGKITAAQPPIFNNWYALSTNIHSISELFFVKYLYKLKSSSLEGSVCLKDVTEYGGLAITKSNFSFKFESFFSLSIYFEDENLSKPSANMIFASPSPFKKVLILAAFTSL